MKKLKKIKINEPRPTKPKLLVDIVGMADKINEIIDRLNDLEKRRK